MGYFFLHKTIRTGEENIGHIHRKIHITLSITNDKSRRNRMPTTPQDTSTPRIKYVKINSLPGLRKVEDKYRNASRKRAEIIPFAKETPYFQIASIIIPDKDATEENQFVHPFFIIQSRHNVTTGLQTLLMKVKEYYELLQKKYPMDILSVSGGIEKSGLIAVVLVRAYENELPKEVKKIFSFLGEEKQENNEQQTIFQEVDVGLNRESIIPIEYTPEELEMHQNIVLYQEEVLQHASEETPFLNMLDFYEQQDLPLYDERRPLVYMLQEKERKIQTVCTYETFSATFEETMKYITGVEKDAYYNVLQGKRNQKDFMEIVEEYVMRTFVKKRRSFPIEDVQTLLAKLKKALFDLYIVQDLIDDPDITDIKITSPYSIRVRIGGKAYSSDVTFVDARDYHRFVDALIIRNNVDASVPEQTFTDDHDENNILRFTITMPYISANGLPVLHIRKVPRRKLLSDDLLRLGMFDEKILNYLLDCGKHSTGVVFAGPPGSGKTVLLNWFLEEAYEDSAEILVIQENDELFTYRNGIMFQHVVQNPVGGQQKCTLEDLGQLALVAGANVFVIGEAKGGEICSAITLANSGCRTSMTIHSRSSLDTIDKMADLAMRGYAQSFEQAKRMLKCFQTIVFISDFKVQEISEVIGYDEQKKDMMYRPIYRRKLDYPDEES